MSLADRARRTWAWAGAHQPGSAIVPLLLLQWLCLLVFAMKAKHNGWLYYQGGDETYYWTFAHQLAHWTLPVTVVGYGWSFLLTPLALVAGVNVLSGMPIVILLNTLVLLPVALLCVYGIAARIGGRYLGYWAAFLWIILPYAAIPMWDGRYHPRYIDTILPQQLGLSVLADFPSTVCLLLTAYLLMRTIDSGDWHDGVLAGLTGAFAIGIKPSNALFFGAAVLCLLLARRWVGTGAFLGSMIPGLVLLALWKQRGLGEQPAFGSLGQTNGDLASTGVAVPVGSLPSPIHRYVTLDWGQLQSNLDQMREFFWAVRPLEFIVFAGAIAIGRRSWPKAALIFFWFMSFFLIKGTDVKARVEDGSFFRLLMPAFPAFVLLLACIPLLLPSFTWSRRALPAAPALRWHPQWRAIGATAAVLVVLPLILIAGPTPMSTPAAVSYQDQNTYVPVTDTFDLSGAREGEKVRLAWKAPYGGKTSTFYTVLRSKYKAADPTGLGSSGDVLRYAIEGAACRDRINGASLNCLLQMKKIRSTRDLEAAVDLPKGKWTYRVGMAANWLDDKGLGDVLLLSKPLTIERK